MEFANLLFQPIIFQNYNNNSNESQNKNDIKEKEDKKEDEKEDKKEKKVEIKKKEEITYPQNEEEEKKLIEIAIKKSEEEARILLEKEKEEEMQIQMAIKESEKDLININNLNELNKKEEKEEFDEEYGICPITQEYMENPVLSPSGNYYEKSAIIDWINRNNTDPLTREHLSIDMLIEDEDYKNEIIKYRKKFNK